MKLILTSNGISSEKVMAEFLKLVGNFEDKKVLVLRSSRKVSDEYGEEILKELKKTGFKESNITFANPFKEDARKDMEENDAIYSAGGNTFTILNAMRKMGYLKLIKKMISKNKVYLGVSAGTILLQKSIDIAGWGSFGDQNYIKLKNLKGLGIIDFEVFPHYEESHEKEVADFENKKSVKVIRMKDGDCLIIKNNHRNS